MREKDVRLERAWDGRMGKTGGKREYQAGREANIETEGCVCVCVCVCVWWGRAEQGRGEDTSWMRGGG